MKHQVFSVYDKAVAAYLQPFFSRSRGEALRSFTDACNDPKSNFGRYALDYSLVYLGEFDDISGVFDGTDPQRVIGANEVIADPVFPPGRELKPESPPANGRG